MKTTNLVGSLFASLYVLAHLRCCSSGFPFSNSVVDRSKTEFRRSKTEETTHLIKAMLQEIPDGYGEPPDGDKRCACNHCGVMQSKYLKALLRMNRRPKMFWQYTDDLQLDSNVLFCMRGETCKNDAGLNPLFTGQQLSRALIHMTRTYYPYHFHNLLSLGWSS